MSPSRMTTSAALLALALCACGTPPTATPPWPETPQKLMDPPASLKSERLKDSPKLSEVETQHALEAKKASLMEEQIIGLQNWIRTQKAAWEQKFPTAPKQP